MKILYSEYFNKIAKNKYPKNEIKPYNPWAVCNESTGGKKEEPEKFERCVKHLKEQNKESKIDDFKDVRGRSFHYRSDPTSDEIFQEKLDEDTSGENERGKSEELDDIWLNSLQKLRSREKGELSLAFVVESKKKEKWIPKDMDEGSFTEYCGGNVTEECIQKGKNSSDKKTKQRANLADTFRNMNKNKKK